MTASGWARNRLRDSLIVVDGVIPAPGVAPGPIVWTRYAVSVLASGVVSVLALWTLILGQSWLP